MPVKYPSSARMALMLALWSFLALASGCGQLTQHRVVEPAPIWRSCLSQAPAIPAGDVTAGEAEELLIGTRAALIICDAQGKSVIASWPR